MRTIIPILFCALLCGVYSTITAQSVPTPSHVVVVVMENHGEDQIIGSSSAPYINSLATDTEGALFTNSNAITHPSQPNYLCLFSGATQNVIGDATPFGFQLPFTTANLGAELLAAGKTFVGYSEDLPSVGFTGDTYNNYARKHAPWVNWQGGTTNGIPASLNQPFTNFPSNFDSLPTLCFVIPNLQDDMHDGTVAQGDTWLQTHINAYVQWAKTHNSLLILTWDEDENTLTSTPITTIFVGQMVQSGQYNENINHYSVLRTMEAMYGLPYAGNSSSATTITDCWVFKPHTGLRANPVALCPGQQSTFTDTSLHVPTVWQWYFGGGSPALSYSQTPPAVTYTTSGNYDVTLITGNHMGFDTLVMHNYVTVYSNPVLTLNADSVAICQGDTVTATAGGASAYTWLPGSSVISSTGNILKARPQNSTTYFVTGTDHGCAGDTAALQVTVNPAVVPSVSLTPGADTTVCSGTSVVFNANAINGGSGVTYQWKVNNNAVGNGNSSFSTLALGSNYTVSCVITSNALCASPTTAASNTIHVTVVNSVTPAITIAATPQGAVCAGTNISVNATPANGGGSPAYRWFVNGNELGVSGAGFTTDSLHNGDVVSCQLISNAACATNDTAVSNVITAVINPSYNSIQNTGICSGGSYNFNGQNLTVAGTYVDTLSTSSGCDSVITLNLTVGASINTTLNEAICSGDSYTFNGQALTTAGTFVDSLTAIGGCDSVVILNLVVNTLPTVSWNGGTDTVNAGSNTVLTGGSPAGGVYAGQGVSGNTFYADSVGPGSFVITYTYTDGNGCTATTTKTFEVIATGIDNLQDLKSILLYPNPVNEKLFVRMQSVPQNMDAGIYDITGRMMTSQYDRTGNSLIFNTESMPAGIYLLRVKFNDLEINKKFVRQ